MEISPLSGASGGSGSGASKAGDAAGLGKDDFLRLLIAQLQNQDPLKPMEDREFITQLAQFRSLEKMQEVSDSLAALLDLQQLTQAAALIGKTIEAKTASGQVVRGVVGEASIVNGVAKLLVDGETVNLHDVMKVSAS